MESVLNAITKHNLIEKSSVIGCAVSGGSDSMCLLHFLSALAAKERQFSVICLNVEHGIRGSASQADTNFVRDYCAQHDIVFVGTSFDVPSYADEQKISLELAARKLRYGFFQKVIEQGMCHRVAVAHNRSDNAESTLMHIFRGSGPAGASGMDFISDKGIIRPLLNTSKEEILQYLHQNDVPFITDESNKDNTFTRNFVRNIILKQAEQRFPGVAENITRFSSVMRQENVYLDNIARRNVFTSGDGYGIKLPLDDMFLRRAALLCCRSLGVYADVTAKNLSDVTALATLQSGKRLDIGGGVSVYREHQSLFFIKKDNTPSKKSNTDTDGLDSDSRQYYVDKSLVNENGQQTTDAAQNITDIQTEFVFGTMSLGEYTVMAERCPRPKTLDGREMYIDGDAIPAGSVIRFRREGDKFKRYKGKTKLLSDYFTDINLPVRLRDRCPLLCIGSEVLSVLPSDISHRVRLTQRTKNIYKITFFGGAASELIQRCRKDTDN